MSRQGRRTVCMALPRRTFHANRLPESHHGMLYLHMGVVNAPLCNYPQAGGTRPPSETRVARVTSAS